MVEVIALKHATGPAVSNFIRDSISVDSGFPSLSSQTTAHLSSIRMSGNYERNMGLTMSSLLLTTPKATEKDEAMNKAVIRILSRMVYDDPKRWADFVPLTCAYRTYKRTSTQATPFSLVYGAEAVVPVKILMPSARLALTSKIDNSRERIHDVKAIEEKDRRLNKMVDLPKEDP